MFKNFIRIAFMNIKKNKNMFFNCIFLIIFLFMIMVTLSIKKTMTQYIVNDNSNNLYHRTFFVWSDTESLEDVRDKLTEIEEVNQISQTYEFSWMGKDNKFMNGDYNGSLGIKGVIRDNLPDIVDGDLSEYDINDGVMRLVCPVLLRPDYTIMFDKNWKDKNPIDTKKLLNKMSIFSDKVDIPYKIIATYDTAVNNADDYECYTYPQTLKDTYLKIDGKVQGDNYVMAIVDSYQNVDKVIEKFKDLKFSYIVMQETSNALMTKVVTVGCMITITVLLISIFIIYFNNCKIMSSRKQEFYLYRILGFGFKQVKSILILENIIVCLISWVCAVFLAILALKGFQFYLLNSIVGNARIVVYIDYLSFLLSLVVSILLPTVVVLLSFNKNSHNLMEEMKQEN